MLEARLYIRQQLMDLYPENEIRSISDQLLETVCGIGRQAFYLHKDINLSETERQQVFEIVDKLKNKCPIQYILGETEFFGKAFQVNEHTLIPRPETEELVELILKQLPDNKDITIWDIGTGTGCIAIILALYARAKVYASDISMKALEVAQRNAIKNQAQVHFFRHDILSDNYPSDILPAWDIIVSNPPYITPEEKKKMDDNVLLYEPHEALFVPQDRPLLFYERIADVGLTCLKENGSLFFEINSSLGRQTQEMLKNKGYRQVFLYQDLSKNDRMILARR